MFSGITTFLGSTLAPLYFLKGWISKVLFLGGGAAAVSIASAAFSKPELIIEKGSNIAETAFHGGVGIISSIFSNTRSVVEQVGGGLYSGILGVKDYLFASTGDVLSKSVPKINPPSMAEYSWFDLFFAPLRYISDSHRCYQQWSPQALDINMLQTKGGLLIGQTPGEDWTIQRKLLHALTNNIYKKPLEVENFISSLFDNKIYLPKWICDGLWEGLDVISQMHAKQAEIASTIDATLFLACIVGILLFFVTIFQGVAPIFKEFLIDQFEAFVNSIRENRRARKIRDLSIYNKEPHAARNQGILTIPLEKPFQIKRGATYEYTKPWGLTGFWGNLANAINISRMAKKGYLKSIFIFLLVRVGGNIYSYMILTDAIIGEKVKLGQNVLENLQICITCPYNEAGLHAVFTKLLQEATFPKFVTFYVYNAPHHKILFGVVVACATVLFAKSCHELLATSANSVKDLIIRRFTPTIAEALPPHATGVGAAASVGGLAGRESNESNTPPQDFVAELAREAYERGAETRMRYGEVGLRQHLERLKEGEKEAEIENALRSFPPDSPTARDVHRNLNVSETDVSHVERLGPDVLCALKDKATTLFSDVKRYLPGATPEDRKEVSKSITDGFKELIEGIHPLE